MTFDQRNASVAALASVALAVLLAPYFLAAQAPEENEEACCILACQEANPRAAGAIPAQNLLLLTFLQEAKQEAAKTETPPERTYVGFFRCTKCHSSGSEGHVELPGGEKLDLMKEAWVLYKEYPIWVQKDKHGQAYTVLLNERSKRIGKKLGISEIHRDRRCLACHTGFPLSEMPVEADGLVERELAKNRDVNLGVSCEGCHGPAGDRHAGNRVVLKGWMDPHQTPPTLPYEKTKSWRFLSPQTKQEEFGYYDVRSPVSKTKLCTSCHLGAVELGRMVTHEMYAAGHPPLPGFELETFTEQMPPHWNEFSRKSPDVRDLFLKYTQDPLYRHKPYQTSDLHRSQALLTGALVTAGEYLRYAGQLAEDDLKTPVARPDWPELALFDCYACHHDLKNPSWRQKRKAPTGVPGRPALQAWPFVLAKIAAKTVGASEADFEAQLAEVNKVFNRQPFGNKKDVTKPALTAANWFIAKSMEREKKPVPNAEGTTLLREIAALAADDILDYDSARQLVWAFQIVSGELAGKYANAEKIQGILEPLGKEMFLLNLRLGSEAATTVPGGTSARKTTEVNLETALPLLARYQPLPFQEKFREIAKLLK